MINNMKISQEIDQNDSEIDILAEKLISSNMNCAF